MQEDASQSGESAPAAETGKESSFRTEFERALKAHKKNNWTEAEQIYRQILQEDPRHFDANHLLGLIALERGQAAIAETHLRRAIEINPNVPAAHNNLGNALQALGREEDALESYEKAISIRPGYPEAHSNRGNALKELNRLDEALASFDRALAFRPEYAEAYNNRGIVLVLQKRLDEAVASYDKAIALLPKYAQAYNNRGNALQELKRYDEAIKDYETAIALRPKYAQAYNNRANALQDLQRFEEAIKDYDKAIAFKANYAQAYNNCGNALAALRRPQEALASYDKAIALKSDYHDARKNRGFTKLVLGRMAEGWQDYENRWNSSTFQSLRPKCSAPEWAGENLKGRSILVYSEQGMGDVIHFSRYLPLLADRGAKVSFLPFGSLAKLLRSLRGDIRLTTAGKLNGNFDFQCPLMSLPYRFKTDLKSIPASIPYLSADPNRSAKWREQIGSHGFKVGICWQGKATTSIDIGRSTPVSELYPLSQVPDVRLISLQKQYGLDQLEHLPQGMKVETLGDDFDDGPDAFVDTAAVMEILDLIVTVDTSVAHLAGALGRPAWIALKYYPEWRWLLDRNDSPWYPSFRLFRQKSQGDWNSVFAEMSTELRKLSGQSAAYAIGDVKTAFAEATDAYQTGNLTKAEQLYRSILKTAPRHFSAMQMLGIVHLDRGDFAKAERQIALAIEIEPGRPAPHNNRGVALRALNRLHEALACYDKAIVIKRDYAEAFNNRGVVLHQLGHFDEALASLDRAIALKPEYPEAHNNRAKTLLAMGRPDEAQASRKRAINLKPGIAKPFTPKQLASAAEQSSSPRDGGEPAVITSDTFSVLVNRGIVLRSLRRAGEALASYDQAIALRPNNAEVHNNRANALRDLQRIDEAIIAFDKAITLKPGYADALANRGYVKLALGDFAGGWRDHEHRWQKKEFLNQAPSLSMPHWTGEDLAGRSIVIYTEQGLGDSIQFCRYLPILVDKGARVTLLCPGSLRRVLRTVSEQIRHAGSPKDVGPVDFQCALMSLPYRLGTDLTNIPARTPYLSADSKHVAAWRKQLGPEGFKIGICWHSKPVALERSFMLAGCCSLAQIPDVRLISLQKSHGLDQLATLPAGMKVETLGDDFDAGKDAFVDTVAVMESLDLVLSCDTAVAHLAGALGRPTWVALAHSSDWRWLLGRSDSPWYPTMRLFRQAAPDDWSGVFEELKTELERTVAAHRRT